MTRMASTLPHFTISSFHTPFREARVKLSKGLAEPCVNLVREQLRDWGCSASGLILHGPLCCLKERAELTWPNPIWLLQLPAIAVL